jgi:Rod binding domain-containing protein
MNVSSINSSIWQSASIHRDGASVPKALNAVGQGRDGKPEESSEELRQAFQSFVGETLFSQMLKAARKTQNKPAYFHGGRAEEMFQQQLDQVLAEKFAQSDGARFSDAMFELFTMKRT